MILTEEHFKKNAHIPTAEIEDDLKAAERELKQYEDERAPLLSNPTENRLKIYMLDGKISKGREFIDELGQLLTHRSNNPA